MSFWEDALNVASYAFPVTAAANGIGEIGDAYWGGNGPVNNLLGLGGGGQTPTAQQLTPEQQAAVAAGFANPSTQPGSGVVQPGSVPNANPYNNPDPGVTPSLGPNGLLPGQQPAASGPISAPVPGSQAAVNAAFQNYAPQNGVGGGQGFAPSGGAAGGVGTPPQPFVAPGTSFGSGPSLRDQALAGFNAGPREAPQATAAQAQTAQMTAPANVQGATINPNATAKGDRTTGQGLGITNTFIDRSGQTRQDQAAQTQRLTNAADGNAPSVAENQLRAGMAQGLQNNLAMAASSRGSGSGAVLAQRQAANNNTALGARTNAQAAQLRAGEMAQARGELTQHLGQVRGQDIQTAGLGTNVAGIGVQQAQIGAQLGTANAGFQQQANLANQQTQFATGQANLNAATQTNLANLSAQQQTNLANVQAQLQQSSMDDAQKMAYLGAVLGIDARTQQGQQQLQQLLAEYKLRTDATNAGIGAANSQAAVDQQNGMLSAGATLGAALI